MARHHKPRTIRWMEKGGLHTLVMHFGAGNGKEPKIRSYRVVGEGKQLGDTETEFRLATGGVLKVQTGEIKGLYPLDL